METKVEDLRNFAVFPASTSLEQIDLNLIPPNAEYILASDEGKVLKIYPLSNVYRALLEESKRKVPLGNLDGDKSFQVLQAGGSLLEIKDLAVDHVLALGADGSVIKVIDSAREGKKLAMLQAIIENFQEEIFVTDSLGQILLVNPRGEQIIGKKAVDLEGHMVEELVQKDLISSSGALAVLKGKKKIAIMQHLKKGNRWRLCTGVPVLNKENEILFTLCTSKDMTELIEIKKELEDVENELKRKDSELHNIQDELFAQVNFISSSAQMREIKETIKKIAPLDLTVLIQGETGAGKEVVARAIHALSPRRKGSFVKISCASFPDSLISSELFGYESGAFTGADCKGRKGKIELAQGGTLFLDEIGEISQDLQIKLLEFLQDMELYRIGGTKKIKVDTRIITATNRNLQVDVTEGRFRKDLYYRLNLIPIHIPPLRERPDDIPALINYYLDLYNRKHVRNISFDDRVVKKFMNHEWPGNVRELEHTLERAVVMHSDDINTREGLVKLIMGTQTKREGVCCPDIIPYKQAKRELERELVEKAYKVYGSTYKAAAVLGIAQSTVVRILKRIEENRR
jgi:PAS domain S-box-containing protein